MKKISIIAFLFGSTMLFSSTSNAQHFYTSFGISQSWNIPSYVHYSIQDNYFGYNVAHVKRFNRHGHTNFNVLLHRNGWYVEIAMDNHGHIYNRKKHRWTNPLMSHSCGAFCGFHRNYYTSYYPKYHGHHHKTVYVTNHHGHKNSHHKKSKNYYSNVHVEKNYGIQSHGNRQKNLNHNTKPQQTRSNTVVRKPEQKRSNTVISKPRHSSRTSSQVRTASTRSTSRVNAINSQRVTGGNSRRSSSDKGLVAYKTERGNRGR